MIIAEIAQAHDGSLGMAHAYIDALKETGVNAIKFQTHIAEAESSKHEPFRTNFSYRDASRFDYWKRMEFTSTEWEGLKKHCEENGLEFISSPFSNAAVDLLETIGVKRYKIGSGEISNLLLLNKIARLHKPVILSSGLSDWDELDMAVQIFKEKKIDISVLQCTTAYPAPPELWKLNLITELKERYNIPVGYSDHSGDIYACLAAAALGAELFEFHVVFSRQMFGPDTKASVEISEVKKMVDGIVNISTAIKVKGDKQLDAETLQLKNIFGKSLAVNRQLDKGTIITEEMLEAKKPAGYGISASEYCKVIGKPLQKQKAQWDFLTEDDIG